MPAKHTGEKAGRARSKRERGAIQTAEEEMWDSDHLQGRSFRAKDLLPNASNHLSRIW